MMKEYTYYDFMEGDEFELVSEEIVDAFRWSVLYEMIQKHKETGKYYRLQYDTDVYQESSWEWSDIAPLQEVEPYEVTEIKYRRV